MTHEVRRFAKRPIDSLTESRDPQLMAGIVCDLRVINGNRGKLGLFKLDDKSGMVEARADEALLNANKNVLKDDELVFIMGKLQPDRFSGGGGLQLTVQQIWDLPSARVRFGKFLRVAVNGKAPDIQRMVKDFPPQREVLDQGEELVKGLPVRLAVQCTGPNGAATAELQLGDAAKFFPTDAALASWTAQADQGQAMIVYDAPGAQA